MWDFLRQAWGALGVVRAWFAVFWSHWYGKVISIGTPIGGAVAFVLKCRQIYWEGRAAKTKALESERQRLLDKAEKQIADILRPHSVLGKSVNELQEESKLGLEDVHEALRSLEAKNQVFFESNQRRWIWGTRRDWNGSRWS
jgi:hypothetical protein